MTPRRAEVSFAVFGAAACALLSLCAFGCSSSRTLSPDAGPPRDPVDPLLVNADLGDCTPTGEAACGCIGDFRRCDTCIDPCRSDAQCQDVAGVCRRYDMTGLLNEWCYLATETGLPEEEPGGDFCQTGLPCVVEALKDGSFGNRYSGPCMPVDYCLRKGSADPPLGVDSKCIYSDGTPLVTGPPPSSCPESVDEREPFCGGACGYDHACPSVYFSIGSGVPGPCVGLSDTRGFGVCSVDLRRCAAEHPDYNKEYLDWCELAFGEPCACMTTTPSLAPEREEQGYFVTARVCEQYASHHEGQVTCRRADWSLFE